MIAALGMLPLAAHATAADATAYGSSYVLDATVLGVQVALPISASSSQTGPGVNSVSPGTLLPINLPGPIDVDLLTVSSTAMVATSGATDESIATTGTLNLLGQISATALTADARAFASPYTAIVSVAGTAVEGLNIGGTVYNSVYPNEVIALAGGGTVTLLEETSTTSCASGIWSANESINLIHVSIPGILGNTDIIVGHSEAHATSPGVCSGNEAVTADAAAALVSVGLNPALIKSKTNFIGIPPTGGSATSAVQPFDVTLAGVTVGSGTVSEAVKGSIGASSASASASATVQSLCLLTASSCVPAKGIFPSTGIGLSAVTAASSSQAGGNVASSSNAGTTIATLSINGEQVNPLTLPPNSMFSLPGVATVIVNEQFAAPNSNGTTITGLEVNLLHIRLLKGGADIIISSVLTGAIDE